MQVLVGLCDFLFASGGLLLDLREAGLQLSQGIGDVSAGRRSVEGRQFLLSFPQPHLESRLALAQSIFTASLGFGGSLGGPLFRATAVLLALASGCFFR
jgi:hypothetical protein